MGRLRVWALVVVGLGAMALAGEEAEPPAGRREEIHRVVEAIARLKLPERNERLRALKTIQRFPAKAIPYLIRAARSDDALFRARVTNALGLVGKGDRDALFAITTLLKDPDAFVRREAIVALAKAGDASHVPAVEPLLADRVPAIRADAVRAVASLDAAKAVERITGFLKHDDAQVRRAALAELVARKAPGLDAMLARSTQDTDAGVRGDALAALAKLRGREAFATLVRLLKDSDAYVRATAVAGLTRLAPGRKPKSPKTPAEREKAREEIEKAKLARQAVPQLLSLLDDASEEVRVAAISALGLLDADRVCVRALERQLAAPSKRVRERTALALGFLGRRRSKGDLYYRRAYRAVPALIQLLADDEVGVRQKAHLALRLILNGKVSFNPRGGEEERQDAIARWQEVWRKTRGPRP